MKKSFSGMAVLASALAVSGAAMAQATARTQTPDARPHHAQMAEPVSKADFVQRRVERLRAADANSDGQVTAEEMRTYAQARRAERRAARFDRLDANNDGVLDREEFNTPRARGERGEGMGARHGGGRNHRDANMRGMARGGEGRFPIVIADVERRANEAFARMDANSDGVLTQDERRAAMRANRGDMRQRHEQRRARTPAASPSAPASE
ncbi:hypothetical protein [Brevundimonas diminuta]|uniref:hypothetical protein n=1 Tax=Brevundimonas diminuta TaxID=293 RepID=UPI000627861A|nr:hypothetical protein [Brevundimonas diminuta]